MTVIKNISNLGFLCDDDTVAHLVLLPEVPKTTRSLYLSYIFQKYDKNKKFFIYLPSFINMSHGQKWWWEWLATVKTPTFPIFLGQKFF